MMNKGFSEKTFEKKSFHMQMKIFFSRFQSRIYKYSISMVEVKIFFNVPKKWKKLFAHLLHIFICFKVADLACFAEIVAGAFFIA